MRPLLLLVDLQNDFLDAPGLEPAAAESSQGAARLLAGARALGVPVVHAVTSVDPRRTTGCRIGRRAGAGAACAERRDTRPRRSSPLATAEPVVSKTFFSAFSSPELEPRSAAAGADTLIVAGVHLHGCVRATVARRLPAGPRGLGRRGRRRERRPAPRRGDAPLPRGTGRAVRAASKSCSRGSGAENSARQRGGARHAADVGARRRPRRGRRPRVWRARHAERARPSRWSHLRERLESERSALARQIAADVGKPVTQGEAEVARTAELLAQGGRPARFSRCSAPEPTPRSAAFRWASSPRSRPGTTRWPFPGARSVPRSRSGTRRLEAGARGDARWRERSLALAREAGLPDGAVRLVAGDHRAANAVMSDPACRRGLAVRLVGGRLGGAGNLRATPHPAPGRARRQQRRDRLDGRRPRAGRGAGGPGRVRLRRSAVHGQPASGRLGRAVRRVPGEGGRRRGGICAGEIPSIPTTEVGPMVSEEARDRVAAAVARARRRSGARLLTPHAAARRRTAGAWSPADARRRGAARERDRAGGDVRPGARPPARAETSRRRSSSPTACGRDSSPRSSRGPVRGASASTAPRGPAF